MAFEVIQAVVRGYGLALRECKGKKPKVKNLILFWVHSAVSLEQRLITAYRVGHELSKVPGFLSRGLRKLLSSRMHRMGSSIAFTAEIEPGLKLPHPFGVVIGEGVQIGKNVGVWQQVTIGSAGRNAAGREYPVIGDNVRLYAKSTVIGVIDVGDDAVIAAGAVVNADVAPGAVVGGVPAKPIGR